MAPFNQDQPVASCVDFILMIIFPIGYIACFIYVFSWSDDLPLIQNCPTICASGHFLFIELGMFMFFWSFVLNLMKRRFYIDFDRAIDDIKHELVKCNPKLALKQVKNRKVKIATAIAVGIVFSTGMVFDGYNMFQ